MVEQTNWTQPGYDPSLHNWRKGVVPGEPYEGWSKNYFFADTLRSIDIAFGLMLHGISVFHTNSEGEPVKQIEVPIKIGPRQKAFDFRVEKETGKKYYIPLPNITYRRTNMTFDGDRMAGKYEQRSFYNEYFEQKGVDYVMANKFWADIMPVPYKLNYEVTIKVEYQDDMDQLVEQITRLFDPDYHINVKEFWFAPIRRCIKVVLDGQSYDYATEFQEQEKREITCNMTFTVDAFIYKPIRQTAIIDQIITKVRTTDKTDYEWTNVIKGNFAPASGSYNEKTGEYMWGSLTDRYDLSRSYGTKIGPMSAVIPELSQPKYDPDSKSYTTKYVYEELSELTNYPFGARQLFLTSACYNSMSELPPYLVGAELQKTVKRIVDSYSASSADKYYGEVKWIDMPERSPSSNAEKADANKVDLQYDTEGNVISASAHDGASAYGGFILNIYKDLEGWGTHKGPTDLYTKDVMLNDYTIVRNAPYMTSAGILHQDK